MFQEVRSRIPSMVAWAENCYGSQPLLYFGDDKIFSSCGVQQGDPLGPLCCALTLHRIVKQIKREVPGLLINAWYLDDGTLCGSPRDICSALTIIESQGPSRGLLLNKNKSLSLVPADAGWPDHVLPPGIPTTNGGIELFGSPVGPPSFCESSVYRRVSKIQDMLVNLQGLHDSQLETTLLRSCLSLPKIAFALLTCAPDFIRPALAAFDNTMREALSDLAGGPLSDWSWLKASLPSSLGGLNLRRAMLHAPAAYVGSLHQSNALIADILGLTCPCPNALLHLRLLQRDHNGPLFKTLMSHSDSASSPGSLMRLLSILSLILPQTLVGEPWFSHLPSLMLATGSMLSLPLPSVCIF